MSPSIAFVGAGPTTLYSLNTLLAGTEGGVTITVFEEQPTAGLGAPYRPGWNDPAMLSNIASVEIPPLTESLLAWMQRQPVADLAAMGIDAAEVDERAFVPRIALGSYFRDQFEALVAAGRARSVDIDIRTRTRVIDITSTENGMLVTFTRQGGVFHEMFDRVVLATGHQWPSEQEVRPGYFLSPWPAEALAATPAVEVGIRGSSLTAIDAAVALAGAHGVFHRMDDGLVYDAAPGTDGFRMTMMSRKGLLPEADFFFPLPHAPLSICTPEAINSLLKSAEADLLDRVFDLFRRELMQADPAYADAMALETATLEDFCEAYFANRAATDPFVWAEANLREARRNHAKRVTVPWRDAILRMHEVVAVIAPHLDGASFERFSRHLKPVFVDDYGAVPHESIERMLALHKAGKLEVLALGDDYRIDAHRPEGGVLLTQGNKARHFPVFVEATGQRPLSAIQFPFLSLLEQGIVRDEVTTETGPSRGIVVNEDFHPMVDGRPLERLFCLGLPFLMGRHPFIQGITSSHDMGEVVGRALARGVRADTPALENMAMTAEAA
ncbi:FAD/NAD(P)-binding protein [Brevundimonas goettingensis]|uniref:FAD/NAD(P)-binding protein n=1 Tax=Brevundimonas goettingensis TaxID=2774190 RepID=A0A975C5B6_9CAUL|nr:FAD/NAD(P)-binding protein [Brevundimonas goettingensis]QTC92235.1 FAD/NAD(P)-binding protein [Brevundimonas goettingensis]